jgi:hypothetical protein
MYEIIFDLPDVGLADDVVLPDNNIPEAALNVAVPNILVLLPNVPAVDNEEVDEPRRYPTQAHQSVLGHQPYYNEHAPHVAFMHHGEEEEERQVTFLQLGETRVHRSVLDAGRFARITKEE